ncbi:MAG: hypothetical protein ACAH17_03770 [Candidatus Paceibacterota bacterium]
MKDTTSWGTYYKHPKLPVFYRTGMLLFSVAMALSIASPLIGGAIYLLSKDGGTFLLRSSTILLFVGIVAGGMLIPPSFLLAKMAANPNLFYANREWKKHGMLISVWVGMFIFYPGVTYMLMVQAATDGYAAEIGLIAQHIRTHSWLFGIAILISVLCFLVIFKYKKMLPEEK